MDPERTAPHTRADIRHLEEGGSQMLLLAVLAAGSGALLGAFADRLAARWPEHDLEAGMAGEAGVLGVAVGTRSERADADPAPLRRIDWRTFLVSAVAASAFAGLLVRWSDPRDLLVLGVYFAALVVLMATDLDQKILPDALTIPLIGYAAVTLVVGWDPLLAEKGLGLASGVAAGVGAPLLLIVTDRLLSGGLGMGDVKLAVALGLMSGASRFFGGFLLASAGASVVLVALIAARRLGLRSSIPFGPVLIAGGFVAALLP